jgi:hypothetical protein
MLIRYTIFSNEIIQTTSCINVNLQTDINVPPQTPWLSQNLLLVQ